ncbi:MAG: U32 family peptidase [Deltaproteobacteria bacterium]|nr:U32 family peptidase [Deltaproteobacteria bacterium]MBN2671585.1 U32 family peptidase [Deltaproteobacteria bacterium]
MNSKIKAGSKNKLPSIELLAPAKDAALGALAVDCGADAVYIGVGPFSARREANNSVSEIAALVRHAHLFQARVYAALNTVLTDAEIETAQGLLNDLYDAGVDGVIIQDMGLLEAGIPNLPVIASTQVHNYDVANIRFLEQVGVSRVILARELRPAQIAQIRAAASQIELECFVHGALCVSYSGRCYLSDAQGGRSANRGHCAQPCRKKYSLEDAHRHVHANGHLLSLRDLCRLDELSALLDAGVTSFKIEGRLKNAAYVQTTVTAYRQALNRLLDARGLPFRDRLSEGVSGEVQKVFQRGFVSHFADGNDRMAGLLTPKMVGEPVGKVAAVRSKSVRLEGVSLHAGDGLCFFKNDSLVGTRVQRVDGDWAVLQKTDGIAVGTALYRNRDHQFYASLEKTSPRRSVPIHVQLAATNDTLEIRARDGLGNDALVEEHGAWEAANDAARMRDAATQAMHKTGNTPFVVETFSVGEGPLPFVPVSVLNGVRRKVLAQLVTLRENQMRAMRQARAFRFTPSPYLGKVDAYHNVCNRFAERFYERCGVSDVARGLEETRNYAGARVMVSKYCLRRELGACLKETNAEQLPEPLWLVDADDERRRLRLRFDCARCEMQVVWEDDAEGKKNR